VVVGAASRDLTEDDRRGWLLGGTVTYAALAAARMGLRVGALVGVDRPAAGAAELDLLEAAGVRLRRVPLERGPVFVNLESEGHRRQRWLSTSGRVPVAALPPEWREATGWLLGPVAGELGDEWSGVAGPGAHVTLGWQGLLREFAADGWVERVGAAPSPLLSAAGLVCASLDDLGPQASFEVLRGFAPAATLVLTAGGRGGFVSCPPEGGSMPGAPGPGPAPDRPAPRRPGTSLASGRPWLGRYRAIQARAIVDPTGAGDVFMAALTAAWLLTGELATSRALRFAAAAGSCAVEGVGLAGVPSAAQIAGRLRPPIG
jgi:hypothetical protein